MVTNDEIAKAMTLQLDRVLDLPSVPPFVEGIRRASKRKFTLDRAETVLAVKNALRYVPEQWHAKLAPEFLDELLTMGRVYAYRFRPAGQIKGNPIDTYPGRCIEGKAFQVMIDNNLDFDVALYPYELVTYGETGQVFQNWMQYRLVKPYLEADDRDQTLVVASGHPVGLFPSHPGAPRVIITNGLMVGEFDDPDELARAAALGVANYGQMTAGGWMYIGPQGIVHGTYSTLLNAGGPHLNLTAGRRPGRPALRLLRSGRHERCPGERRRASPAASGSSPRSTSPASRRGTLRAGWTGSSSRPRRGLPARPRAPDAEEARLDRLPRQHRRPARIRRGQRCAIELLSDQTSCHAAYEGGYCPQGLTFEAADAAAGRPTLPIYRGLVDASLRRHFELIGILVGAAPISSTTATAS